MARFDSDDGTPLLLEALQDLQSLVPDWADDALCIGRWDEFDASLEGSGRPSNEFRAKVQKAVETCQFCPVRTQCLEDALAEEMNTEAEHLVGYIHTIRGGLTPAERISIILRKNTSRFR